MTLKTRKPKINQSVAAIREIYRRDKTHRAYFLYSPESGKPYQVITDWTVSKDNILTIECGLYDYAMIGNYAHPANKSKYICCQFLAAVKWAAKQAGKIVSLCETIEDAKRLLRFGGQLLRIKNQSGTVVWATVR